MRHVTDGELHAFLDGGLDLLSEGRGDEVREHLSNCAACRERLQDEEEIRSRSAEILSGPSLEGVSLPSFEELRERAETSSASEDAGGRAVVGDQPYRRPLTGLPMAWAATIILAVGVGWMGGQVWSNLPKDGTPRGTIPIVEDTPSPSLHRADLESGMAESPAEDLRMDSARREEPRAAGAGDASGSGGDVEDRLSRTGEEVSETGRKAAAAQQGETSPVTPKVGIPAEETEAQRAVPAMQLVPRTLDAARLQGEAESALGLREEVVRIPDLGTDSVENSLAVPGLKVVSIGWEERVPGEKALLIRQVLSPGDTLELRYLGMLLGEEPEPRVGRAALTPLEGTRSDRAFANILEASLPPGWAQVVMERGRGLLVARAPISEANLKALLKSLR